MSSPWIEAMRLRTLPVSIAGVIIAVGYALAFDTFQWLPASLCLLYAVLGQIASNFANEYYDFKAGLDRPGREGPRRGVTEGDITPRAMKIATYGLIAAACVVGCCLIPFAGWWLIPVGIAIALGVIAYSAGPYPLSRHCLGEVAVIFFFGIIPVNFTFYLQSGYFCLPVMLGSLSAGLLGANVLIVNNYRDRDADAEVGKTTLAVRFGRRPMLWLYGINGLLAVGLMMGMWIKGGPFGIVLAAVLAAVIMMVQRQLRTRQGAALNPVLGMTAVTMLAYALTFTIFEAIL